MRLINAISTLYTTKLEKSQFLTFTKIAKYNNNQTGGAPLCSCSSSYLNLHCPIDKDTVMCCAFQTADKVSDIQITYIYQIYFQSNLSFKTHQKRTLRPDESYGFSKQSIHL